MKYPLNRHQRRLRKTFFRQWTRNVQLTERLMKISKFDSGKFCDKKR